MLINDPIGDALSRIRNAQLRKRNTVLVPYSKVIESVAQIFKTEEYIEDYKIIDSETGNQRMLEISLRYLDDKPAITKLRRISKPGLRKYLGYRDIPKVLNGLGTSIFTTPRGIMTGESAKNEKIGGEFLCIVY